MEFTQREKEFLNRMEIHMENGMSFNDAACQIMEDDERVFETLVTNPKVEKEIIESMGKDIYRTVNGKTDYTNKQVWRYKNFKRDYECTSIEFRVLPIGENLPEDWREFWTKCDPETLENSSAEFLYVQGNMEAFGWL